VVLDWNGMAWPPGAGSLKAAVSGVTLLTEVEMIRPGSNGSEERLA
jgi:hypothetical protein